MVNSLIIPCKEYNAISKATSSRKPLLITRAKNNGFLCVLITLGHTLSLYMYFNVISLPLQCWLVVMLFSLKYFQEKKIHLSMLDIELSFPGPEYQPMRASMAAWCLHPRPLHVATPYCQCWPPGKGAAMLPWAEHILQSAWLIQCILYLCRLF